MGNDEILQEGLNWFSIAATLMGTASAYAATFKDVKESHWAYSAVGWGVEKGITTGYGNGSFKPNAPVTSEEFLSMLIRSYKGKLVATAGQRWSDPYYAVAKENNYPVGTSRYAKITRAKVAELISGTQGKTTPETTPFGTCWLAVSLEARHPTQFTATKATTR